jgi:hypothetical protein
MSPVCNPPERNAQDPYSDRVRQHMQVFYDSLSEKDRRRYAAIEAEKLGYGGVEYVAALLGCDPKTIRHGHVDLEQLPDDEAGDRVRKKGRSEDS